MPAELFFSNSAGLLLDRLGESLAVGDPMVAPRIATPTSAMRRMVQMGLAERLGAVANLDFLQLEQALWNGLARLDAFRQADDRKPAKLIDPASLQNLLLAQLLNQPPTAAAEYMNLAVNTPVTNSFTNSFAWHKATQLAARLAHLFREYEYSRVRENGREGLAALWLNGKPCFEGYVDKDVAPATRDRIRHLEAWQGELYRAVFGLGGLRDRMGEETGQYLYTLPQYCEMVFGQPSPGNSNWDAPPLLHLFGLAHVSPFHRSLIRLLSDSAATRNRPANFKIFALNPCAEYWEDVTTSRAKLTARQKATPSKPLQQNLLSQEKFVGWRSLTEIEKKRTHIHDDVLWAESLDEIENDNALLSRWGNVGRENIQLWCQITDYDFAGQFREPDQTSLLSQVQSSVLHRIGTLNSSERVCQDKSLRIVTASEKHLEIEAIQSDMLERLAQDKTLRPDDIAIALVQPEIYGPVVDRVLGARLSNESGFIPFVRPEANAATLDLFVSGLNDLLAIAELGWERSQLLSLLSNPRCLAKMELDETDGTVIREAVIELNLYQNQPAQKTDLPGSQASPDPHSFTTGLFRLLLGRWMETPAEGKADSFLGYVPHSLTRLNENTLGQWIAWMDAIQIALTPFNTDSPMPMAQWAEAFIQLVSVAIQPNEESPVEMGRWRALNHSQSDWAFFDTCHLLVNGKIEKPLSKTLFLSGLRHQLAESIATGSLWLSGGVQVGSLDALRGIPFRILYVPGLQEGDFPDEPLKNSLDLRQFRRVIGDLEPASRNRYALLIALMQTRDAVMLSYVDKDLERNQDRQPSSAISEFTDILAADFLKDETGNPTSFQLTPIAPTHFFSKPNRELSNRQTGKNHTLAKLKLSLPEELNLDEVGRFIRHPREQCLQWNLGLDQRWDDEIEEVESYAMAPFLKNRIGLNIVAQIARSGLPLEFSSQAEIHLQALKLRGALPPGRFGEDTRQKFLVELNEWWATLSNEMALHWGQAGARSIQSFRLGKAWPKQPELPRQDWPAPCIGSTSLHGYLGFGFYKAEGGLGFLLPSLSSSATPWTTLLTPFLFGMAALLDKTELSERIHEFPMEIFVRPILNPTKKRKSFRLHLKREIAAEWWKTLAHRWQGLPMEAWPPALDLWGNMIKPGGNNWPWHQSHDKQKIWNDQVNRIEAFAHLEPQPGKSVLQEVRQLLPNEPIGPLMPWIESVFQPLFQATESVGAKEKKK